MKTPAYVGAVVGVIALIIVAVHAGFPAMLRTLSSGGPGVLWLIPYRALFFLLYAVGWAALLKSSEPARHIGFGYVLWATTVRDAVDRLLPVASVGGSVVGVRLLRWRGVSGAAAGATIVVDLTGARGHARPARERSFSQAPAGAHSLLGGRGRDIAGDGGSRPRSPRVAPPAAASQASPRR